MPNTTSHDQQLKHVSIPSISKAILLPSDQALTHPMYAAACLVVLAHQSLSFQQSTAREMGPLHPE